MWNCPFLLKFWELKTKTLEIKTLLLLLKTHPAISNDFG